MEKGIQSTDTQAGVARVVAFTAIVVGVVLRVVEYVRDRPLWLDEAMLALNIGTRSFRELARPLDYDQSAPVLFLWIERAIVVLGGVQERTLRLLPFLAGIALIPLAWIVCRRIADNVAAAIVTVLLAVSVTLVTFSAEAKQYGMDPLVALAAVGLAWSVATSPHESRRWWWLVGGGALCVIISQPAVFALGGVLSALVADERVRGTASGRRWLAVVGAVWAGLFAVLYFVLYRSAAESAYMQRFWEGTFLDPRAADFLPRLEMFATAAFAAPAGHSSVAAAAIIGAMWLFGVVALWRSDRRSGLMVAAPLTLAASASAFGFYPVMDRLYLFAAPLTLLGVAAFLAWLIARAPEQSRSASMAAIAAALALVSAPTHAARITNPVYYGVGKQVVADIDAMSRGEPVYVAARSFPLWVYYTTDWAHPDRDRLAWAASIASAGKPAHNNAPPRGRSVHASEAAALSRRYRGRIELVGLPTGRQYTTSTRTLDPRLAAAEYALPLVPDTGWAALEVRRMAEVARPRLWVFGSHMFALDGAEPGLVAELQRRGVRLVMERRQGSTVGYHVEFPSEP